MSDLHYYRSDWVTPSTEVLTADVALYGATSAGCVAAIACVQRGLSVVVLNPGRHVGGLTTGGLGWTDFGKQHVIGGLAREFYRRVGKQFGQDEEWYLPPSAAQRSMDGWLAEHGIAVRAGCYLESVDVVAGRVERLRCLGGLTVVARVFLDCTYEGDLLAAAGCEYVVGREANGLYGETLSGIQVRGLHQFVPAEVSPFVVAGDPSSGLLPLIEAEDLTARQGEGDHRVQAYNFRVCMTDDPDLKVAWQRPEGYDPRLYVLADRWFSGPKDHYNEHLRGDPTRGVKFDVLTHRTPGGHRKTDTNNHGPVSSDFIGANWAWPEAGYAEREAIFQSHVTYQQGFYWHMANSPDIPERYRSAYAHWGLARDEHTNSGHWPPQLYIREARRLVGEYVLTEADCRHQRGCDDPIAMGSYTMDSHNCTRFVNQDGKVMNEGDVQAQPAGPYGISYRCMVPRGGGGGNLLVPVCVSTSHIAYGSVRMEPVFMALGHAAGLAASVALRSARPVAEVPYTDLCRLLDEAGQVTVL